MRYCSGWIGTQKQFYFKLKEWQHKYLTGEAISKLSLNLTLTDGENGLKLRHIPENSALSETIRNLSLTGVPLRWWSAHWCVNEVQEVALPLMAVEKRGCLSLDCDAPLSLHLKFVQYLFVLLRLRYSTYFDRDTLLLITQHVWLHGCKRFLKNKNIHVVQNEKTI